MEFYLSHVFVLLTLKSKLVIGIEPQFSLWLYFALCLWISHRLAKVTSQLVHATSAVKKVISLVNAKVLRRLVLAVSQFVHAISAVKKVISLGNAKVLQRLVLAVQAAGLWCYSLCFGTFFSLLSLWRSYYCYSKAKGNWIECLIYICRGAKGIVYHRPRPENQDSVEKRKKI